MDTWYISSRIIGDGRDHVGFLFGEGHLGWWKYLYFGLFFFISGFVEEYLGEEIVVSLDSFGRDDYLLLLFLFIGLAVVDDVPFRLFL